MLLAAGLGLAVLGAVPWSAAAADESAPPSTAPSPTPTPAPSATPTPAPTATPAPTGSPQPIRRPAPVVVIRPRPTPQPTPVTTSVNLYRASAMVRQYTNYWCVPAATQSMVNLVRGTTNRTYATQKFFYKQARRLNKYSYTTRGVDPQGWSATVRAYSGKPYKSYAFTSKSKALDTIVASIARTGDPVGVTVHSGTHAWVVLGYKTRHDPADPSDKTILGFYVSGPLGTSSDMWPYRYLTVASFNGHFTRYHESTRSVPWEGTWVVIAQ